MDQIFIVRQEKEGQVHQLEEEIQSIQRKQEQLINELAPMKLEQYKVRRCRVVAFTSVSTSMS